MSAATEWIVDDHCVSGAEMMHLNGSPYTQASTSKMNWNMGCMTQQMAVPIEKGTGLVQPFLDIC